MGASGVQHAGVEFRSLPARRQRREVAHIVRAFRMLSAIVRNPSD